MKRSISLLSLTLATMASGCESPVNKPVPVQTGAPTGGGYTYGNVRGYDSAPVPAPLPSVTVNPAAGGSYPTATGFNVPTDIPPNAIPNVGLSTLPPVDPFAQLSGLTIEMAPMQVAPDSGPAITSGAVLADAVAAVPQTTSATSQSAAPAPVATAATMTQAYTSPTIVYQPVYTPAYYPVYVEQPTVVYVESQYLFYPVYEPIFIERRREICLGVVIRERDDRRGDGRDGPRDATRGPRELTKVPMIVRVQPSKDNTILPPPKEGGRVTVPVSTSTPTKVIAGTPVVGPTAPTVAAGSGSRVQTSLDRGLPPIPPAPVAPAPAAGPVARDNQPTAKQTWVLPSTKGSAPVVTAAPKAVAPVVVPAPKSGTPVVAPLPKVDSIPSPKVNPAPASKVDWAPAVADRKPEISSTPARIPTPTKVDVPTRTAAPASLAIPAAPRVAPAPVAIPEAVIKSSAPTIKSPEPVVRAAPDPVRVAPAIETPRTSSSPGKITLPDSDKKK